MPERIPVLDASFFSFLRGMGLHDIAKRVVSAFLSEDVHATVLEDMVVDTLNFDIPLVEVEPGIFALELFHGPTMAFKDVGARFMSRLMAYLHREDERPLKVVVATSGDTGSAVAAGFHKVPGIDVYVLFPAGKVSPLQQKQITTWGGNIHAIEVDGTFDDCQHLAKQVLGDRELNQRCLLTSANSINIARLIPQMIYYFHAVARVGNPEKPLVISVPSGNFGNLTAGLMAVKMGLKVERFVAATNCNDVVPEYYESGVFRPRSSMQTISNAMDVGNPSNFARMTDLFGNSHSSFSDSIFACGFTDKQTLEAIFDVYNRTGYLMDPHGAVALLGGRRYLSMLSHPTKMIFLETAHPAKFSEAIAEIVGEVPLPPQLQAVKDKIEQFVSISKDISSLKSILIS